MKSYLEFERDVKILEDELEKLKDPFNEEGITEVDTQKISRIQSGNIQGNSIGQFFITTLRNTSWTLWTLQSVTNRHR